MQVTKNNYAYHSVALRLVFKLALKPSLIEHLYYFVWICYRKFPSYSLVAHKSAPAKTHTHWPAHTTPVLLPCPVHLCYSPAPSQGPSHIQPHQLLQQPSVECGHSITKMHNESTGYAALNRPDWTTLIDKRHS